MTWGRTCFQESVLYKQQCFEEGKSVLKASFLHFVRKQAGLSLDLVVVMSTAFLPLKMIKEAADMNDITMIHDERSDIGPHGP